MTKVYSLAYRVIISSKHLAYDTEEETEKNGHLASLGRRRRNDKECDTAAIEEREQAAELCWFIKIRNW